MALVESLVKQPGEEFYIYGSILKVQATNETVVLASSTVKAVSSNQRDVSTTLLDQTTLQLYSDPTGTATNNALLVRVRAGTVLYSPYSVKFLLVTSLGNKYEVDVKVTIRETGTQTSTTSTTTTTTTA